MHIISTAARPRLVSSSRQGLLYYLFSTSTSSSVKAKMPPKKQVVEKKIMLGKASNNLAMGIVGVPNVGKSSFFNVLTRCGTLALALVPVLCLRARTDAPRDYITRRSRKGKPRAQAAYMGEPLVTLDLV